MNFYLDFNQILYLLIIWFAFSLFLVRCLLAVVNRGFRLVDYAQEKLYPGGKPPGAKSGLGGIIQMGAEILMPIAKQKALEWAGMAPKK